MSILNNAIDSIIVGVEDYQINTHRRLISSTRNIYAGILLLFKHKLSELSPKGSDEVLIKQKLLPHKNIDGKLEWVGRGNKTVDTVQIKERLKALNIDVDWNRLKKINDYRNNIEHYYSQESKKAVESLISSSFLLIRDFITNHLDRDPQELLGIDTWKHLIDIDEVYRAEKNRCNQSFYFLQEMKTRLYNAIIEYSCAECGSDLILNIDYNRSVCKSCNYEYEQEILYENALVENIYWRHGEEEELISCPDCNRNTYIVLEKQCQLCSLSILDVCIRCGSEIRSDELEESYLDSLGLCSYCMYQVYKDD